VPLSASPALLRLRSDDQLVALFRDGRDDAFTVIHDRHRPALLRYARHMLRARGEAAAEDVVQDVFLRAHQALRRDDRPMALRAWLYRIAHNRCLDELRVRVAEELEDRHPAPHGAEDAVARSQRLRELVGDINELPEQQRSALVIRELAGLSYAEIAEALDTTVPAVKSLLVRARINLAQAAQLRDAQAAIGAPASTRRGLGVPRTA
jgi:RNA polymerase sigma factor (sigma-70 family)